MLIEQIAKQQASIEKVSTKVIALEEANKKAEHKKMSRLKSFIHVQNQMMLMEEESDIAPSHTSGKQKSSLRLKREECKKNRVNKNLLKVTPKKRKNCKHTPKVSTKIISVKNCKKSGPIIGPIATPIKPTLNELPASVIDQSSLISIEEVLRKYGSLITIENPVCLTRKLAREAVIGEEVLKQCSPRGQSCYPALPTDALYTIKQTLLNVFPVYWTKPEKFEIIWKKCMHTIGQECCKYRANEKELMDHEDVNQSMPSPLM